MNSNSSSDWLKPYYLDNLRFNIFLLAAKIKYFDFNSCLYNLNVDIFSKKITYCKSYLEHIIIKSQPAFVFLFAFYHNLLKMPLIQHQSKDASMIASILCMALSQYQHLL